MFRAAEFRLAKPGEDDRDGLPGGFPYALIEIQALPSTLTSKQPRTRGCAGAHKSGEANERTRASFTTHGAEHRERVVVIAGWSNQSRLRMLIVPSKVVNSTLARPALKVPNKLLPKRL